jgi:hypothetical protein
MDEQEQEARIAAAFRDATAHAPPAGFDAGDVVATSRRITRRRRSALAGGALAVLAVAGIGLTAGLGSGPGAPLTTASAGVAADSASAAGEGSAGADAAAPEAARAAAPEIAPAPGAGPAGPVPPAPQPTSHSAAAAAGGGPLGPGTGECADRQDPALRALVEQALPEVVGAPEAATTQECRPGGERGLALEVRDGTSSGVLSVTYLPPGPTDRVPDGARTAPTASGGTVVVSSRAERHDDPAPFADRLDGVVVYLAPLL